MASLLKIEPIFWVEPNRGRIFISYWDERPTIQEVKEAFCYMFVDLENGENPEERAERSGFWYSWDEKFKFEPQNLHDPAVHLPGLWIIPLCQIV